MVLGGIAPRPHGGIGSKVVALGLLTIGALGQGNDLPAVVDDR